MSDLLRTVLTTPDQDRPDGALTRDPYVVLDDGRAMWLVPVTIDAVISLPRLLNVVGQSGGGTVTLGESNRPIEMNVRYAMVRLEEPDDDCPNGCQAPCDCHD